MTTPNLGMTKPTVGADADNWGGELNGNLDLIDARLPKIGFSAYLNSATQSIPTSVSTKVMLSAEEFDVGGFFDSMTNYRFRPNVAGYYQFSAQAGFAATTAGGMSVFLFKNGVVAKRGADVPFGGVNVAKPVVSALIFMNGSTDYVELFVFQGSGGSMNLIGGTNPDQNYLTGFLAFPA